VIKITSIHGIWGWMGWHMLVIPATQEKEISFAVQGQPRQTSKQDHISTRKN
jgi:hypothetical protein